MYREAEIRQARGLTAGGARKIKTLQCLFVCLHQFLKIIIIKKLSRSLTEFYFSI